MGSYGLTYNITTSRTTVHVGDVDSLDFCEDSNLDLPGEESSSDMQFTDTSSSDAVSELNDSLYVPTPDKTEMSGISKSGIHGLG